MLAKIVTELPLILISGSLYAIIFYKLGHEIDESFRFWVFVAVFTVHILTVHVYGVFVGVVSAPNERVAGILAIIIFIITTVLNPTTTPVHDYPPYLSWMSYASYSTQCFIVVLHLIYGFDRCPAGQTPKVLWDLKIDDPNCVWWSGFALCAHLIGVLTLAFVVLVIKANRK